jgi:hypothetical protein
MNINMEHGTWNMEHGTWNMDIKLGLETWGTWNT